MYVFYFHQYVLFPSCLRIDIKSCGEKGEFTERINRFPNGRTNPKLKATKSSILLLLRRRYGIPPSLSSPLLFFSLPFSRQFLTVKIRRVNRNESMRVKRNDVRGDATISKPCYKASSFRVYAPSKRMCPRNTKLPLFTRRILRDITTLAELST